MRELIELLSPLLFIVVAIGSLYFPKRTVIASALACIAAHQTGTEATANFTLLSLLFALLLATQVEPEPGHSTP